MNHFILFAMSVGFGSFAWMMLAVSDWLLGDKPKRSVSQRVQSPFVERPSTDPFRSRSDLSRLIVPEARKAS
jgi:hypothetical protein